MTQLQRIVDQLQRTTGRPVAISDAGGRMLAYSTHEGPVDPVRTASILTRRTPDSAFAWSRSHGIEDARDPIRLPANEELGQAPRICAPIRFEGRLLGYLWLVDSDGPLADASLEFVRSAAEAAGLSIHREQLVEELERGREREMLRDLLSDQSELRTHAAESLIERNLLVPGGTVTAIVVRPVRDRSGIDSGDASVRVAIERGLTRTRATLPTGQALHLVRHDHGLLVLTSTGRVDDDVATRAATALRDALSQELLADEGWRAVVGIGEPQERLDQTITSYEQARRAAEVAGVVESFAPVLHWRDLGVYQVLLELPLDRLTESSLHPGVQLLVESRDGEVWLQTLEQYLDSGCDARASAEALGVQRGSLYHRLRRIEDIAEVDLRRGDDRLALHLSLKIARLTGVLERLDR